MTKALDVRNALCQVRTEYMSNPLGFGRNKHEAIRRNNNNPPEYRPHRPVPELCLTSTPRDETTFRWARLLRCQIKFLHSASFVEGVEMPEGGDQRRVRHLHEENIEWHSQPSLRRNALQVGRLREPLRHCRQQLGALF